MAEEDDIALRSFDSEDFGDLAELIAKILCDDLSPRVGSLTSKIQLADYLAQTTWSLVAMRGDELLGAVLLAEKDREPEDRAFWESLKSGLLATASSDEDLAAKVSQGVALGSEKAALSAEFADEDSVVTGAEVLLLVVSPQARGLGLGGYLLDAAQDHVRWRGLPGYYLITDDGCDVGFYEHRSLVQSMRRSSGAEKGFCIYVYSQRF